MGKLREVEGTYGGSKTPSTIYIYENRDGSSWYVAEGSVNVNKTYDTIEEGVNIEELSDDDVFTASKPISSLSDLEASVDDEPYAKGGKAGEKKDLPTWKYTSGIEWSPNQVLQEFHEQAKKKFGKTLDRNDEFELMTQAKEQAKASQIDTDSIVDMLGEYFPSDEFGKGGKVTSKDLLERLKAGDKITENEVSLIKNRMNNKREDEQSKELVQWIWDNQPELTPEQNKKGVDFLKNLWKSPTGKVRSSNPFGHREEQALETFEHFTLDGFHDIGRGGRSVYIPIYGVYGKEGNFQYYYDFSGVHIIGAKGGSMATGGELESEAKKYGYTLQEWRHLGEIGRKNIRSGMTRKELEERHNELYGQKSSGGSMATGGGVEKFKVGDEVIVSDSMYNRYKQIGEIVELTGEDGGDKWLGYYVKFPDGKRELFWSGTIQNPSSFHPSETKKKFLGIFNNGGSMATGGELESEAKKYGYTLQEWRHLGEIGRKNIRSGMTRKELEERHNELYGQKSSGGSMATGGEAGSDIKDLFDKLKSYLDSTYQQIGNPQLAISNWMTEQSASIDAGAKSLFEKLGMDLGTTYSTIEVPSMAVDKWAMENKIEFGKGGKTSAGGKWMTDYSKVSYIPSDTAHKQEPLIIGVTDDNAIYYVDVNNNRNHWSGQPEPSRGFSMSGSTCEINTMQEAKRYSKQFWEDFFHDKRELDDMNERLGTNFRSAKSASQHVLNVDGELHGFDDDRELGTVDYKNKTWIFQAVSGGQNDDYMNPDKLKRVYVDEKTLKQLRDMWKNYHLKKLPAKMEIPVVEQDKEAILIDAIKTAREKESGGEFMEKGGDVMSAEMKKYVASIPKFKSEAEYQSYIRKHNKLPDHVIIGTMIFTMDDIDSDGKEVYYGNKAKSKTMLVSTSNRYGSSKFSDAKVEMSDMSSYRNDINYIQEKGGKLKSSFWSSFSDDGALVSGGSYFKSVPTEKKGIGGLIIGLGLGAVGGYMYRDNIHKAKEKAKWSVIEKIDMLGEGGSASGRARDRKYTSQQEHELKYAGKRKSEILQYNKHEKGGATGSEADKIASKFKPVATKHDGDSKDGYSVLVKDKNSDFSAWVDVHISDNDVISDWNKYIFHLNDAKDVRQKALQENTDIFDMATSEAIDYLEKKDAIHQGEKGWSYGKKLATGGEASGIARDRKYTSQEEHELGYKPNRKSRVRYYQKGD